MPGFLHFISYHNAVPTAITLMIVGAGVTFAATDPEAIYSSEQEVVSVDNTYIANKDLSMFSPRIEIAEVTEDEQNYYVAYSFYTIDVADYVWRDVVKKNTLTVSKEGLGTYGDLGLYATEQFNQLIGHESAYLKEVQTAAQKNMSQKTIATSYGGLVGKFLDSQTETLPGYEPVVTPPSLPDSSQTVAVGNSGNQPPANAQGVTNQVEVLQIVGDNPSLVPLGSTYVDLGVYVVDIRYQQFATKTLLDGQEVSSVNIDTTKVGEWHVRYEVTDGQGSTPSATRTVIVFDPNPPPGEIISPPSEASSTTSTATSSSDIVPVEPTSSGSATEISSPEPVNIPEQQSAETAPPEETPNPDVPTP